MLRLLFKSFFLIIFFNFIFTNIPSKNNHNILNDAPVLDFIPGQNIDEDTEFNYTLSATDNDLDALTFQVSINGNGNASITGQNNLEITPNLNFYGTIIVSITVSDGQLDDAQSFNLTVNSINDAPEEIQEILDINVDEDGSVNDINLANYFSDIEDGNNLSYSVVNSTHLNNDITTSINNSILSIGLIADKYDSGQLIITALDSESSTARQWVNITINPINDPPVLDFSNTPSIIEINNLYEYLVSPGNSDIDDNQFNYSVSINPDIGDPISITATQNNQYGQLQWTPSLVGSYDITIIVEDWNSSGGSNGQLDDSYTINNIQVTENNQNIPPVINSIDNQSIDEEITFTYDLAITDAETSVSLLSVNVYDEYPGHNSYHTDIDVNYVNNNWRVTVIPEGNWNGDINIIVTVNDGTNTSVEEFLLTINQVNDPPSFEFIDLIQFNEDSNYTHDILIEDMDARNYYNKDATETITYTIQSLESNPNISVSLDEETIIFNNEHESTASFFSGGTDRNTITFIPDPDFYGTEEFQLIISDLEGEEYSQNFYVQVQNVNDDPILDFVPDQNFDEDTFSSTISLNATDIDSNPSNFVYSCISQNQLLVCDVNGSEIILSNVNKHFNGIETIIITVEDGDNGSDYQNVTVTVNPINDNPTIEDGVLSAVEDGDSVNDSVSLLVEDIDADGISSYTVDQDIPTGQGTLILDPITGDYSFNPGIDFQELAEGEQTTTTFIFHATDAGGVDTENATVTITVTGVNDLPTAEDGTNTAVEDGGTISGSVNTADVDSDGIISHTIETDVNEGSTILNNDGSYTFDPGVDFQDLPQGATRDVFFTYYASDPYGNSETKTITITVTGENDAPIADDGTNTAQEDGGVINGVATSADVDTGSTLTYTLLTNVIEGSAVLNNDGTYTFDPGNNFQGLAQNETQDVSFTYKATDDLNQDSNTATITITVTGVNDLPTAEDGTNTAIEDGGTVSGTVYNNGIPNDVDSDGIDYYLIHTGLDEGILEEITIDNITHYIHPVDGSYTFHPRLNIDFQDLAEGATRDVFFTYSAIDPHGEMSDIKTITITVTGVDDVTVLTAETYEVNGVSQGQLPSLCNHDYKIEINEDETLRINFKIDDIDSEDTHSLNLESKYLINNQNSDIDKNLCFFDECIVDDATNNGYCDLNCAPNFNAEFVQYFTTKKCNACETEATITVHINIKQVNDKVSEVILEENIFNYPNNANLDPAVLGIPNDDLFKYNDDTKFFVDDNSDTYLINSSDTLKNFSEQYNNSQSQNFNHYMYQYHEYMKDDLPEFYFIWKKSEDVDTNPTINNSPYNLYYRLELVENINNNINYYVLKDSINNENFIDIDYAWTLVEFDLENEYPFYSSNQIYIPNNQILDNNNVSEKQKISYIDGESKYSWRVVAQNYSLIELNDSQQECTSNEYKIWNDEEGKCLQYDEYSYYANQQQGIGLVNNNDDAAAMIAFNQSDPSMEFYLDFQYLKGSIFLLLNEFYIDHYDLYVQFDSPLIRYEDISYDDQFYLNYVDGYLDVNESFEFKDLGNDTYTYHSNGLFEEFGTLTFYYISVDNHRNAYIGRKYYTYEFVFPDEIKSIRSPSNNVFVEFSKNSFNQEARVLIDENEYKNNNDIIAGSNIITIQSQQELKETMKIKFLQESIIQEYEFKDLSVYKIDGEDLVKISSYEVNNKLEAYIHDFGSYVLLYDENKKDDEIILPEKFGIEACYPNPFNPIVSIDYNIDKDSNIKLVVYNLLGQEIKILEDNYKQQGSYTTFWNGLNNNGDIMPSGLYFIKISNFEFQDIKRVTLLK